MMLKIVRLLLTSFPGGGGGGGRGGGAHVPDSLLKSPSVSFIKSLALRTFDFMLRSTASSTSRTPGIRKTSGMNTKPAGSLTTQGIRMIKVGRPNNISSSASNGSLLRRNSASLLRCLVYGGGGELRDDRHA